MTIKEAKDLARITPACAGRSDAVYATYSIRQDHPRLRGEKCAINKIDKKGKGSPPPARGEVCNLNVDEEFGRITPACAGRRYSLFVLRRPYWDHPRLRGEKYFLILLMMKIKGSPPPARGEGEKGIPRVAHGGITPACAGRSIVYVNSQGVIRDHPRLRGEKPILYLTPTRTRGSPPPAPGQVRNK